MLDLEYILKVGRLLDDTGTPRPGFVDDDADNFEGPELTSSRSTLGATQARKGTNLSNRTVTVCVDTVVDGESGDVRLVSRRSE